MTDETTRGDTPETAAIRERLAKIGRADQFLTDVENHHRGRAIYCDSCAGAAQRDPEAFSAGSEEDYRDDAAQHREDAKLAADIRASLPDIAHLLTELASSRAALSEAEERIKALRAALERIGRGEGAYSMDQLTHAENVIAEAVQTAARALVETASVSEEARTSLPLASEDDYVECPNCDGWAEHVNSGDGSHCPMCDGTGEIFRPAPSPEGDPQ